MPKEGRKQAVLRKNVSKKRKSGFRGTSVHELKRQNKEKRPKVGVTFVDEDDVVSELIPPPAVPASSRKIQVSETESLSDENSYNAFESANGYRLVSMDSLRKFCNRIHSHSTCSSDHVELEEDGTSRFGLSSSIYARCDECGMSELLATGYLKSDATLPNTIQGKDLNRRVVYGAFEMGLGREGIAKLCKVLDMPFSISIDTWYRHEDALLEAHTDVVREELAKNRAESRKLAFLEMGEEDNNENVIAEVPVSFDGTWSRRGYSANHCVSFVISAASGKVLDFEVISNVCSQCNQKKANCTQEAFEDWLQTHDCQGSYGGSSPSMEMECAKRLWGRSEQFGLMYKWMISDGDSKSYSSIWNIYGACDTCNCFEKMEPTSKEYISWAASSDYKEWEEGHLQGTADCNRVIKLDCIDHVQKRLGKALYDFQKSTTKLEDGKPVKGRNGRLTKTEIEKT